MHATIAIAHARCADLLDASLETGLIGATALCNGRWSDRTRAHRMRVGSRHPTHRKPHSPACACDQTSELSADHVLKHLAIKRQVGNNLLQLRVLIFKLLQPPHLRRLHAIVALLPN